MTKAPTTALTRPTTQPARSPRRPMAYAGVWFALTAPLSFAATAIQEATGFPDPDLLALVMLAPALAAAITFLALRRWAPAPTSAVGSAGFAGRMLAAFVWCLVVYVAFSAVDGRWGTIPLTVAGAPLVVLIALQLLGALCEEIGYRGVALTAMESRWSLPVAALANGTVFGLVHIQYWAAGPLDVAVFVLSTVGMVAGMVVIADRGTFWQRVSLVTVVHLGANLVAFALARDEMSPAGFAAACWAGTAVAYAVRRVMR